MFNRKSALSLAGAIAGITILAAAHARTEPSNASYVTFNSPVSLPGVTLGAGTYAFELADPASNQDLVVVRNKQRDRLYYVGHTLEIPRPAGLQPQDQIILGESRVNVPPPIKAWFPAGYTYGRAFQYSTH
jgi:hypothetical protein